MNATTPAGNPATDSTVDQPNGRHGDVDLNGDLVDRLERDLVDELERLADRERALDDRLVPAICAATPELAADQLRAVKQLVRPWTVTP